MVSTAIISALNNYNSITPIVTKDLIENGGRTAMAYCNAGKETRKYEATEKFIEANAASLLWYGAIPFVKKVFDKTAFKLAHLNPNVSLELLEDVQKNQNIDEVIKKIDKGELAKQFSVQKGLFKRTTEQIDAKEVLTSIKNNAKAYKNLHMARFVLSTLIPVAISMFVLPKAIIAFTKSNIENTKKHPEAANNFLPYPLNTISMRGNSHVSMYSFINSLNKNKNVSMGGKHNVFADFQNNSNENVSFGSFANLSKMLLSKSTKAQKTLLDDMIGVDLGISGSRIYYANKREQEALNGKKTNAPYAAALEKLIREGGFLLLIYKCGDWLKTSIDKLTNNKFDPLVIEDSEFVNELKNNKFAINPIKNMDEKTALDYIDKNIADDSNVFIKYAKKLNLIETVQNSDGKVSRNPLKYLELDKLNKNFDDMVETASNFLKNNNGNLTDFVKHKIMTKRLGIYGNLAIGTFAVCYLLPKLVYSFRKWYTGTSEEPGIAKVIQSDK